MADGYKYQKRYRHRYPEKWAAEKARYYHRSQDAATRARYEWTTEEINAVLAREEPDSVLAKRFGRSVKAIHQKRFKLKRSGEDAVGSPSGDGLENGQ